VRKKIPESKEKKKKQKGKGKWAKGGVAWVPEEKRKPAVNEQNSETELLAGRGGGVSRYTKKRHDRKRERKKTNKRKV